MPEVTGETTLNIILENQDIENIIKFMRHLPGAKLGLSNGRLAIRTKAGIEFEETGEATLEFELCDYAREHDEP